MLSPEGALDFFFNQDRDYRGTPQQSLHKSKVISPGPLLADLQFRVSTAYLLGRETLGPACDSLASSSFFSWNRPHLRV